MKTKITYLIMMIAALVFSPLSFAAETEAKAIGQVVIASGEFYALNANKEKRPLERRSPIFEGDTLITGTDGRGQVRFTDDSVISLRASSEYRIDKYVFNPNIPKDNASVGSLVKGGLRSLTGVIGKQNPQAVKVETPVAVIGIRGTDFTIVLEEGELFIDVKDGEISVFNDAGTLLVGSNQPFDYAMVKSKSVVPAGLTKPPKVFSCPD